MNRKIVSIFIIAIVIIGGVFLIRELTMTDYQKSVRKFDQVTVEQIDKKIEGKESFMLYIGSEECPYCVEFVRLLENRRKKNGFEMSYLDEKKGDTAENLQSFRQRYQVSFLPRVITVSKGEISYPETPRNQEAVNRFIDDFINQK